MIKIFFSIFCLLNVVFAFDLEHSIEDTNIVKSTKHNLEDYNRLRVALTLKSDQLQNSLFKVIADNENISNHTQNDNNSSIYRAYYRYVDDKNLLTIGLQRVPFGVGRIWTPMDIFNPIDSTAIETELRDGVRSIRYQYAIDSVTNTDITYSKDKKAFRIKGYLDIADVALIILNDNLNKQNIYGYELEGQLFDTGIALRSEGGYFRDKLTHNVSKKYIIGAEYGFENSLTLLGEYHYDEQTNAKQFGTTVSYTITPLLNIKVLDIKDFDNQRNSMISSSLEYSLADDMTIAYGYFHYDWQDVQYIKFFISF